MPAPTLGVYVHIPFCRRKCRYCDFTSFAGKEELINPYIEALIKEIELKAGMLSEYTVDTIFFGGGTPTLMGSSMIQAILEALARHYRIDPLAEITVEGNPATVEKHEPALLRKAGVNRFSMGVQSFDRELLRVLGRIHSCDDVLRTYDNLRLAGFDNINFDLIYGIPHQTRDVWLADLQKAVSLSPEHLSLYGLQVEEGTPMAADVAQGRLCEPAEEEIAEMFFSADALAVQAGYNHYEISNFAFPGRKCRHNLKYWHYLPYIGLGCAAHSFVDGIRASNVDSLECYLQRIAEGKPATAAQDQPIKGRDELFEYIMLAFRTAEGVNEVEFSRRFGADLNLLLPKVADFMHKGLLVKESGAVRMTPEAWHISNYILSRILPD